METDVATVEAADRIGKTVDRRAFLKRFALSAGMVVAAGFMKNSDAVADGIISNGTSSQFAQEPLVKLLKEFVLSTYIKHDQSKSNAALEGLKRHLITEEDLTPLINVNGKLMGKGLFLTYYYVDSLVGFPVIKLFRTAKKDMFDGFMVEGRKKTSFFGAPFNPFHRVLLGEELFSTYNAAPAALYYQLSLDNSSEPTWVIAVPYLWVKKLYAHHGKAVVDGMVESLTIHEITHIIHNTHLETLPFLAQFGYRMDWDRKVQSVSDIIDYLNSTPQVFHPLERLLLEKIFYADYYYAKSGNVVHMDALSEIRQKLIEVCREINRRDPKYPKKILSISDQQAYASMEFLYHAALERNGPREAQIGALNLST